VTHPGAIPDLRSRLETWLEQDHHGTMKWMEKRRDQRASPLALWEQTRSIVMLGMNYGPDHNPLDSLRYHDKGLVSVYAQGRDYHDIIKGKLKELAGFLHAQTGAQMKVFVDTAPVMEKPLAQAAGLGWQGKHTVLISRELGNWLFLGALFTDADIPVDEPETDHCGSCTKCLDICPTQAFPSPYVLDARRCISYLTIEHQGPIPLELRPLMGNHIFGCDDCLAVCPWNKFARKGKEAKLSARPDIALRPLEELAKLDDASFRLLFAGTPVKRTGRERFIRNVLMAIGNSKNASLINSAKDLLNDPSPVVRDAAQWAVERLET
jgi:epoxyqueuosine reductase